MIHIAFNIDDSYKKQCETVIRSILANTKEKVTFHIIGVKTFNIEGVRAFCYEKPDISMLKYTVQVAHISMTSTFRLFIPFILNDLDKVIYLDSDLIVLDDIKKLWERKVKYIGGVRDGLYKTQARKNNLNHTYINSGVMVLNLKNLRQLNYLERIEQTQDGKHNLSLLDQDIINIAFEKEIELIPEVWNVPAKIYSEATEEMIQARNNPSIIHWCGWAKPWKDEVWQADKWKKYVKREPFKGKKAIVLTYAPVDEEERELLLNTDVLKIACNWHAEELKPDLRLTLDDKNTIEKCLAVGKQDIISGSYRYPDERVKTCFSLPKRYSSLLSCCDYLVLKGYTHILLIANNKQANNQDIKTSFQKLNKEGISSLKDLAFIYKYRDEAVFDVPTMTVKEFLMMNEEEMILGITEEKKENRLLKGLAFSDACLYKVQTKGLNNASIENGKTLDAILPFDKKQEILSGTVKIECNNLLIERLTGVEPEKEEEVPEKEFEEVITKIEKAPDENMTYPQMKKYVQDNNIKTKSMKKEDLIKAIWG